MSISNIDRLHQVLDTIPVNKAGSFRSYLLDPVNWEKALQDTLRYMRLDVQGPELTAKGRRPVS